MTPFDEDADDIAGEEADIELEIEQFSLRKHREFRRLAETVARAARKVASGERRRATTLGLNLVEQIAGVTNERLWEAIDEGTGGKDSGRQLKLWHHVYQPHLAGKKRLEPHIRVDDVEDCASQYLRLPYRVDELDRLMVDMLIAAEMFAYADEVQPVLKRKLPLLLSWLLNNAASVAIAAIIAAGLIWLAPESTAMGWVAGIIFGLTVLGTAWSLIAFPFFYPGLRRQHQGVRDRIGAMVDAYVALAGQPTSVKHLGERLAKATDAGVVWPSPLFVLMEDIQARRNAI